MLGWISVGLSGLLLLLLLISIFVNARYGVSGTGILLLVLAIASTGGLAVGTVLALRRNMVGRWLYVGFAGLLVLTAILCVAMSSGVWMILSLLLMLGIFGVAIPAALFLFLGDANSWFGGSGFGAIASATGWGAPGSGPAMAPPPLGGSQPAAAPPGAPVAAGADSGVTRACPYCAEQIRPEATKCRFCGSEVQPLA